jgi:two-component system chemotaxis response regulator CheB
MADKIIRVLIVEDSQTISQMLVKYIGDEEDIEVVGVAANGEEAVKIVPKLKPDIIVMDINMPIMNGFEATKRIMQEYPIPILLITSSWDIGDVKVSLKSMGIGALAVLEKPKGIGAPEFKQQMNELILHVRLLSEIKVVRRWKEKRALNTLQKLEAASISKKSFKVVVIGASTGGPPVLSEILEELPSDYPLPILVVQHMSKGFIDNFVEWMREHCLINIKIAQNGERLKSGNVYFGADGQHLTIDKGKVKFCNPVEGDMFVPSVSKLFASAADYFPEETVAILLSGMGRDGAQEMRVLKDKGAFTIVQDEMSSVVFGMAKEAINLGGVDVVLSSREIKATLEKFIVSKDEI